MKNYRIPTVIAILLGLIMGVFIMQMVVQPNYAFGQQQTQFKYAQPLSTSYIGSTHYVFFFDTQTGDIWRYDVYEFSSRGGAKASGRPEFVGKLTTLGKPLTMEQ